VKTLTLVHANVKTLELAERAIPPNNYKYAIIKHRPRDVGGLRFAPDTVPIQDQPARTGKGHTIPISPAWFRHLHAINSEGGYAYIRSIGAMWINNDYDQDDPLAMAWAESVNCGGNFIAYDRETKTHVHLVAQDHTLHADTELNPLISNWFSMPWLYWKACAISKYGQIRNVASGLDVYFALIQYGDLWMHKDSLELFPEGNYNYQLRATNVYDGNRPLMTVARDRTRTFYTNWRINETGVVPPA
jgi:hypothetical protein